MTTLILMRHGESVWNRKNLFTGWVDVPLSPKGIEEALEAGRQIAEIPIDVIYTTTLVRAQMTAMLAMSVHGEGKTPVFLHEGEGQQEEWGTFKSSVPTIPVYRAWELNERWYGDLQGLNKDECRAKFGKEQVQIWRRSYDVPPPNGEALQDTVRRAVPYFEERIVPHLKKGKNVLVSAHGNSLRGIIMQLDGLSPDQVVQLEIPTGVPIFYTYEAGVFTRSDDLPR